VSMINASKLLRKQGLNPHTKHEAKVVDNNDPRKLGRIKARIKEIFDGIPDCKLPWAIPLHGHPDGAFHGGRMQGDPKKWSGMIYIPKVDSKVILQFFNGDPHFPVWSGYTIDEQTFLPESIRHYPNRCVFRFQNGAHMIIDTETNEVFINNPGDVNMTVLGDLNQYVAGGNHTLKVDDNMETIPSYILNAPDTKLYEQSPHPYSNPAGKIRFEGLYGHKPPEGHQHFFVKGNQTMHIRGNRRIIIEGNDELYVSGFQIVVVGKFQASSVGFGGNAAAGIAVAAPGGNDQTTVVARHQTHKVEANEEYTVMGTQRHTVMGSQYHAISGIAKHTASTIFLN